MFPKHLFLEKLNIASFLELANGALLLDVRSPSEYRHASLPGAINLPLFSDEERAVVGTAYKQQSRQQAIKIGLDYFGPKMRKMVEEVESLLFHRSMPDGEKTTGNTHPQKNTVLLYCWRGGMRSGAVGWLLNLYGFDVKILTGGYKSFRRWVLEKFTQPYRLNVLGGYTGSGKTQMLKALAAEGEPVIDLEALAGHKGSAFGHIGMPPQPSQEMFENLLAVSLETVSGEFHMHAQHQPSVATAPVWVEDESQRLGSINIPAPFWQTMRRSPVFFLDIDFEERLKHIVEEYGACPQQKLAEGILRISKRLGGLETKKAIACLNEDNVQACFRLLLEYYDKQYLKALHNRENLSALLTTISCTATDATPIRLLLAKPTVL